MTQSKIWRISKAGNISRLKLVKESLPSLDAGLIRVQVRAVGLNFADIFALTGLYSATPKGPFVPGLEFAGVVMAIGGEARSAFVVGDRVMGGIRFGSYAQYVDVMPSNMAPLPQNGPSSRVLPLLFRDSPLYMPCAIWVT